jgi:hypothetical protein
LVRIIMEEDGTVGIMMDDLAVLTVVEKRR